MHFVMATKGGEWATAFETRSDVVPPKPTPLMLLVMALEGEPGAPKMWNVNGVGLEVERGLIVGFRDIVDANHFLETPRGREPRAIRVIVNEGDVVAFADFDQAAWFVATGRAVHMTEDEVRAHYMRAPDASPAAEPDAEASEPAAPKPRGRRNKG